MQTQSHHLPNKQSVFKSSCSLVILHLPMPFNCALFCGPQLLLSTELVFWSQLYKIMFFTSKWHFINALTSFVNFEWIVVIFFCSTLSLTEIDWVQKTCGCWDWILLYHITTWHSIASWYHERTQFELVLIFYCFFHNGYYKMKLDASYEKNVAKKSKYSNQLFNVNPQI